MGEVSKKVVELNEQETFQSAMTYEEDQKLILNTEKEISFNEGIEQEKLEIAKNLLKLGTIDIEDISKSTGLSQEEISNLTV